MFQSDLRDKLGLLDGKIERTETVMFQINDTQSKLKVTFICLISSFINNTKQMNYLLFEVKGEVTYMNSVYLSFNLLYLWFLIIFA